MSIHHSAASLLATPGSMALSLSPARLSKMRPSGGTRGLEVLVRSCASAVLIASRMDRNFFFFLFFGQIDRLVGCTARLLNSLI